MGTSVSSSRTSGAAPTDRRRPERRRRRRSTALALALTMVVAACSGDDGGGDAAGADDPAGCGSAPATAASAAGDGTPADADRSAILRWGAMRAESMDPIRAVGVDYAPLHAVFDTLISISPEDGSLLPRLATEWDAAPSADGG